jgi:hypothetical protein
MNSQIAFSVRSGKQRLSLFKLCESCQQPVKFSSIVRLSTSFTQSAIKGKSL